MSEKYNYGAWRDESGEVGHKAERYFEKILEGYAELGLIRVVSENDYGTDFKNEAFFRTTAKTDFEEGYDFGYYDAVSKKWHKIDLTTIADTVKRRVKEIKNEKEGIKTLFIPLKTLKNASLSRATTQDPNEYQQEVFDKLTATIRH